MPRKKQHAAKPDGPFTGTGLFLCHPVFSPVAADSTCVHTRTQTHVCSVLFLTSHHMYTIQIVYMQRVPVCVCVCVRARARRRDWPADRIGPDTVDGAFPGRRPSPNVSPSSLPPHAALDRCPGQHAWLRPGRRRICFTIESTRGANARFSFGVRDIVHAPADFLLRRTVVFGRFRLKKIYPKHANVYG